MKIKPYAFIHDWGGYRDQTMVVVGTKDVGDLVYFFKRFKVYPKLAKDFIEWWRNNKTPDTDNGSFICVESDHGRMTILYLKEWPKKAQWENYEILMHELHHAVHIILGEKRGMANEKEALAYAQEILFNRIRRKLDRIDKCEIITLKK